MSNMQQLVFPKWNLCTKTKYIFVSELFQILLFIFLVIYTSHGDTFHHMGERKSHISFKHERLLRTLQLKTVYIPTPRPSSCIMSKNYLTKSLHSSSGTFQHVKNVFKRMTLKYVQFLMRFYKYLSDKDIQNLKKSYKKPLNFLEHLDIVIVFWDLVTSFEFKQL